MSTKPVSAEAEVIEFHDAAEFENVRKVEALTAVGRMRPSGVFEVEAAKADGRWDAAYSSRKRTTVPPEEIE